MRTHDLLPAGGGRPFANSAVAASFNTTGQKQAASVVIPGGALGPNGFMEVQFHWSMTNNANAKYFGVLFGGATAYNFGYGSIRQLRHRMIIANRNDDAVQIATNFDVTGFGTSLNEPVALAIDTSADRTLTLIGETTVGGDVITLEQFTVFLYPG